MHKRVAGLLAAGVMALSAVAAAVPASAAPAPWTITPGGPANGTAGTTILTVRDSSGSDLQMSCASSTAGVVLERGTVPGPKLATIPETGGIAFQNCILAGLITFDVTQVGDWTINGVSYDGTNVTNGTIDGINALVIGPGCNATVAGSVKGTYTNSTDVLATVPDFTLSVTRVDAVDDCLGLLHVGDTAAFNGAYSVTPDQTITG
ncbi:hypothetical protein [Actinophytocola sp.]|jgi:hypothetical protein|uniref:hypothetical protein n=1 Tax=Actinophytocola sp. TaxID=1872138 RepID=UPI002EDA5318